ncbi:dihydrodipicolinate reductase DapB (plasmid) [Gordonia polyisoprenivorans VH2]|uniref:Dihydrodipicolinate reductase DapB n=1 Tax=Gordonia polyisoprenivorans (strain DSM 44266 / VH2) TaxID=1112204 RepID=H6N584_GORPV|nr:MULTISPECIES: diacylglycerol kinase [Gordonia]AFA76129.1 dihydrodipicolinate reductase DapB [Gordonia polyisoprenivorans VH2]MDF3283289.1 diacylglycerol kinase [Gordonia sp. N1V]OPX15146.1 diacylglycerol kinase [Gordonia sp. i37]
MGDVGDPAIRVAVVGTGNAGRLALAQVIADPRFDLVAVGVHSPEKVGLDAATITGAADTTGVVATEGLDAVIAASPQCVVYCAMGDTRPIEATADVVRLLSAGIHVVGSAPGPLQYPWGAMPPKAIDKVATAALDHDAAVFITGVDPGFVSDLIPLAFSGTCQHVEQIRCMEIADYATYDGTEVMVDVMGFGAPLDQTPMLFLPGILGLAWGTSLHQIAAAMDVTIDEIVERHESEPAPEDFEVATGTIAKGTRAAVRFEIIGMVDGKPGIVIEHVTRLRGDLRPDWAQPAQPGGCYRVEITGEPSYRIDICPTSRKGDHNHAAIVAAAGRIVNAIPAVVAGPAGIRTTLDLPLISGPRLTPTALT